MSVAEARKRSAPHREPCGSGDRLANCSPSTQSARQIRACYQAATCWHRINLAYLQTPAHRSLPRAELDPGFWVLLVTSRLTSFWKRSHPDTLHVIPAILRRTLPLMRRIRLRLQGARTQRPREMSRANRYLPKNAHQARLGKAARSLAPTLDGCAALRKPA